tara:strand:+ start:902 stop:1498 length:597 start_codon:yes stop_codon:yes gene_type:complete
MALISNGTTIFDAGAMAAGLGGNMSFISKLTADGSYSTLTFASGITSTYKEYVFIFTNIHPQTDDKNFTVNFRDGGSNYDATKTTSYFHAVHGEDDSTSLAYITGHDTAQGTGAQIIAEGISNDADHGVSGILHLYAPSSTTFVKQFMCRSQATRHSDIASDVHVGGYVNVTAAINGVQFAMSSGNIDAGVISMYGIA